MAQRRSPKLDERQKFKHEALAHILLRGVFSSRIVENSFQRQAAKSSVRLSAQEMEVLMLETMTELGIGGERDRGGRPQLP